MPATHTIQQGETLTRIAKQYKFSSWKDLYNHPDNADFRTSRDNPNLIFPGDIINIPDPEPQKISVQGGASHTFQLGNEVEVFRLRLLDDDGEPLEGARVVLDLGSQLVDIEVGEDGHIKVPLANGDESTGNLEVYADSTDEEPTQVFEVQLAHLDPVEELSGVQARCNLLDHNCGVADGVMGENTRAGVKSFQEAYNLDIDGEPGPITKSKLKEVYGS